MPRFGPFFNKIHEKLEEAKISDLNHELGKLAQGSAAYWGSFKADAGSLFKSGSSKLWSGGRHNAPSGLPKSVSLPAGFARSSDNNNTRYLGAAHKWRHTNLTVSVMQKSLSLVMWRIFINVPLHEHIAWLHFYFMTCLSLSISLPHSRSILSSQFSNCIQNDVMSHCLSRTVGLKKPILKLL